MKAEHITYIVMDCRSRHVARVTNSARKALSQLQKGKRIEVWSGDVLIDTVYDSTRPKFKKYVERERVYIAQKQARAEHRNKLRVVRI